MAANYNYFDGITVGTPTCAFLLGIKDIIGSSGFSLTHSRFEDVGRVVQEDWAGSKEIYIADNVMIGRHDPLHVTSWNHPEAFARYPASPLPSRRNTRSKSMARGSSSPTITSPTSTMPSTSRRMAIPSTDPSAQASSIDVFGNDMFNMADNCVELDGGVHNVRRFDNRCMNVTGGAFSTQPIFGGPPISSATWSTTRPTGGGLKLLDSPAGRPDLPEHVYR
jgi:hypothetical protein